MSSRMLENFHNMGWYHRILFICHVYVYNMFLSVTLIRNPANVSYIPNKLFFYMLISKNHYIQNKLLKFRISLKSINKLWQNREMNVLCNLRILFSVCRNFWYLYGLHVFNMKRNWVTKMGYEMSRNQII